MKIAVLFVVLVCCVQGQVPGQPFTLIRVIRTSGVPVMEGGRISGYPSNGAAVDVVGLQSITGPSQTWLVEGHVSFAGLEGLDKILASSGVSGAAADSEDLLHSRSSSWLGLFRQTLSYRPEEALKLLSTAHYFQVTIFRTRPGTEYEFVELIKQRRQNFDSVNLDRPEAGYQVISGAESSTYIFLSPIVSLRTVDNNLARMPLFADGAGHAPAKAGLDVFRESYLFRVEPRLSSVSDVFAAGDPAFWRGAAEK